MGRSLIFWMMFGGWASLSLLSVVVPLLTPATAEGFVRGLNRVSLFLLYQAGAITLAAALLAMARSQPAGPRRRLAQTPALVALAQLLALGAVILWGQFAAGPA